MERSTWSQDTTRSLEKVDELPGELRPGVDIVVGESPVLREGNTSTLRRNERVYKSEVMREHHKYVRSHVPNLLSLLKPLARPLCNMDGTCLYRLIVATGR